MIIPDQFEKKVKIPVRITDGDIYYFYGGDFPKIKNTIGDLVIPAHSLTNPAAALEFSFEDVSVILPKGATLMANIRIDTDGEGVLTRSKNPDAKLPNGLNLGYVEIYLNEEPLRLWHRGTKSSVLNPCRCFIPALEQVATSLNHAYTLISKRFETARQANTGNVFTKMFYEDENGNWQQLKNLRDRFDRRFEKRYVAPNVKCDAPIGLFDSPEPQKQDQDQPKRKRSESVILRERRSDDGGEISWLHAYVDEDGRLVLEGYDLGSFVEEVWGDSDYEYWRMVKPEFLNSVLLHLIKDRFNSDSEFHKWLQEKEIPDEFTSWA
ncbi:MAG: hypothetical protein ABI999_17200 [Acidobacteriota bacterium]